MVMRAMPLVTMLAAPARVGLELRCQPRWVAASSVIALLTALTTFLIHPFAMQALCVSLIGKVGGNQIDGALAASESMMYVGLVLTPVPLLARWLIVSAVLYMAAIVLDVPAPAFRPLFAVTVHAELILVLMGLVNLLCLYWRGVGSIQHPLDLYAIPGLDAFLACRSCDIPLFVLLNNINAFSLWYLVVLGTGFCAVTEAGVLRTALIVTGIWSLGVGIQVAIALASSRFASVLTR